MPRAEKIDESRVSILYELSKVIASSLEPRRVLGSIIDAAIKITRANSGSLLLIDKETNKLKIEVTRRYPQRLGAKTVLKVGEGITGWVAKKGVPLSVPDVSRNKRYIEIDEDIRSELAVPLILEEEVIGVINVNSLRVHAFSEEDLGFLVSLASQSAQIIKNAKLFDAVRRRAEELAVLFDVGKSITGTLNLGEVLKQIVRRAALLMGTKLCSLMLLDDTCRELMIKAVHGGTQKYVKRPNLKVSESFVGRVVKARRPLSSIDVRKERGYKYLDLARREGLCSLLSVPLMVKGEAIGVLNVYKSTPYIFSKGEIQLLKSIADLSAIAIENARLYERIMELEERIRAMEKLGVMGEMAAEVAHEIRSPLTTIKMLISTLRGSDGKDKRVIEEEIERINKMVARLLDYSRPKEPRVEMMDINKILDETILLLEHRIGQQKIEVKRSYSQIPPLEADPERLRQAFLNLSLNALDAMPSGGALTISTRAPGGESVQVKISDSGNGIPSRIKNKIFLPFITTKEAGLGLGLSIVHRAIEEHRGTIKVESRKNKGTTFTIKIPRS